MASVHYGICNFCDAACGLEVEFEGTEAVSVRGDKSHTFSRGHVCPKGIAQQDVTNDPDRLRSPMKREGSTWTPISWNQAYKELGARMAAIQKQSGYDALGVYYGNPASHSYDSLLTLYPFLKGLRTRSVFSAASVDSLARMLVSKLLFGNQGILPIPDLERTGLLLIIGANPVVSQGSLMTAPDCKARLREQVSRGMKMIVIDPRFTETAKMADQHHFIRPGADALLLLAMLHTLFAEDRVDPGALAPRLRNLDGLRSCAAAYEPERVAETVGIGADGIRSLARQFAEAPTAVCYGRMGISTQAFGSLATWLADVLNLVTGNLDRPGGAMFTTPAVDIVRFTNLVGESGHFDRWRSRVGGLSEFNGELPSVAMAEEMETPGPGQVKALITLAGNPVLSLANGTRLERAFSRLEYMVSIDLYRNETTRFADLILPSISPLEADHFPLLEHAMGVRNYVQYCPKPFPTGEGKKQNWEIMQDVVEAIDRGRGLLGSMRGTARRRIFQALSPRRQVDLLLRLGPHRLSLKKLAAHPHGLDLGPLEPRLDKILSTRDKKIDLVPEVLARDLPRLERALVGETVLPSETLQLVSRRTLRSANSWLHNSRRLVRGRPRCTLQMHPADATRLGLTDGEVVKVSSRTGDIEVPLAVSDEMMPGVVSMPFGWGHDREGTGLSVASQQPGSSMNDITDDALYDEVCGMTVLDGIPVTVRSVR